MEIQVTQQISFSELNKIHFNLFIIALGYEKKGVYLLEKFNIQSDRRIAFAYTERQKTLNRKENENIIRENDFEIIPASGEQKINLDSELQSLCNLNYHRIIKILIDYSCMTKVWYSGIIKTLSSLSLNCQNVEVYFSYTPAAYNILRKQKAASLINSVVFDNKKYLDPSKPIALIIGLGLNNLRAEKLIKSIKPAATYFFYADPALNSEYVKRVLNNNQEIIYSVKIRNLLNYPLKDLKKIDDMLTSLCLDLRLKYNIIIAPVGPKVFSLISLLLACRYPDLDIWRVSAGPYEPINDKIADGDPLIYKVDFVTDEMELDE
jgi:hypothetical protein